MVELTFEKRPWGSGGPRWLLFSANTQLYKNIAISITHTGVIEKRNISQIQILNFQKNIVSVLHQDEGGNESVH